MHEPSIFHHTLRMNYIDMRCRNKYILYVRRVLPLDVWPEILGFLQILEFQQHQILRDSRKISAGCHELSVFVAVRAGPGKGPAQQITESMRDQCIVRYIFRTESIIISA